MAFDATRVCNNILQRAFDEDVPVTPMKLQKILYFVASEYAKDTEKPLLSEPFQQWQYGPVVASVYSEFKPFGSGSIRRYAKDSQGKAYVVNESKNPRLREALDRVWPVVKDRGAVPLSRITHLPESAWRKAFDANERYIDEDDIRLDETYRPKLGLD
ncbi:hypothetical protein BS297_25645 [Rhodococcus erythropolis]|uniref:Antitoxin SocA-like Panacea domain-containing protein n=1 Tax=Rhodococcus erythropolis TaxID=1833 RepID=A0A5N5DXK9_RHOER|nr:hypothetical protein BS297_25645 [Rhodococcus erythropolis]